MTHAAGARWTLAGADVTMPATQHAAHGTMAPHRAGRAAAQGGLPVAPINRFPGRGRALAFALLLAAASPPSWPDAPAAKPPTAAEAAGEAARRAMVHGPDKVALKDQAQLDLPAGYGFIPRKEAAELMRLMGNTSDSRFIGLVVPVGEHAADWIISVEYEPGGYVKDDDAKHWDADELLRTLKDGTESGNVQRAAVGQPEIVVTRWIEPPAYDATTHRLVWSAEAKLKKGDDPDPTVNYNTYVLGRDGYLSLDLITATSAIAADKQEARRMLERVSYNSGKAYADFNSSTDKVAAYGLAALVAGVAAKKLGLLALAGAAIIKFGKVIALAAASAGAGAMKWFKSRRQRGDGTNA